MGIHHYLSFIEEVCFMGFTFLINVLFLMNLKKGIYGNSQSGMIIFNLFNASYQSKSLTFSYWNIFKLTPKIWHVSLLQKCVPIIFGRTNNLLKIECLWVIAISSCIMNIFNTYLSEFDQNKKIIIVPLSVKELPQKQT